VKMKRAQRPDAVTRLARKIPLHASEDALAELLPEMSPKALTKLLGLLGPKRWFDIANIMNHLCVRGFCPDDVHFCAALHLIGSAGKIPEVLRLHKVATSLHDGARPKVTEATIRVCAQHGMLVEVSEHLLCLERPPCPEVANALLQAVARGGLPWLAVNLLIEIAEVGNATPTVVTTLVSTLLNSGSLAAAAAVVDHMTLACFTLDTVGIEACARVGKWKEALQLREGLLRNGEFLPSSTHAFVLVACGKANEWLRVLELVRELHGTGHLDLRCLNAAVDALGHCGRASEAVSLVQEAPRLGIIPDIVTYNTALHALAKQGHLTQALALADEALHELDATPRTLAALLHAAAVAKQPDVADEILVQMRRHGVQPDRFCHANYIRALTDDRPERVLAALDRCCEPLDHAVFHAALEALATNGTLTHLSTVLQHMASVGLTYSDVTAAVVLKAACRPNTSRSDSPREQRALLDVLGLLRHHGVPLTPKAFATAISALGKCGQWSDAERLLDDAMAADITPDVVVFNAAMHAAVASGVPEQACVVFELLQRHGCTPDPVTWTTLICCYGQLGRLRDAVDVYRTLLSSGVGGSGDAAPTNAILDAAWPVRETGYRVWGEAERDRVHVWPVSEWSVRCVPCACPVRVQCVLSECDTA